MWQTELNWGGVRPCITAGNNKRNCSCIHVSAKGVFAIGCQAFDAVGLSFQFSTNSIIQEVSLTLQS